MFATLFTITLVALPFISGVAADNDFAVGAPKSISACKPASFSWEAAKAPYNLVLVESDKPCGDILAELGDHSGTTYTWNNVSLPSSYIGKQITLSIEDADGNEGWSDGFTYEACTTTSSSSSASTTLTPAAAVGAGTTTIPYTPAAQTTTSAGAVAVGAANAGANPLSNGAFSARQTSASVLVASVVAGLFAFSL